MGCGDMAVVMCGWLLACGDMAVVKCGWLLACASNHRKSKHRRAVGTWIWQCVRGCLLVLQTAGIGDPEALHFAMDRSTDACWHVQNQIIHLPLNFCSNKCVKRREMATCSHTRTSPSAQEVMEV
eukprot:scaffold250549_cov21-Tisochrysis_lutea.AAC.1